MKRQMEIVVVVAELSNVWVSEAEVKDPLGNKYFRQTEIFVVVAELSNVWGSEAEVKDPLGNNYFSYICSHCRRNFSS